jgi:hypothetical protein
MKKWPILLAPAMLAAGTVAAGPGTKQFQEILTGYEEVPAISTAASGAFHARIGDDETSVSWELSYADLEGDVLQSHLHLGQPGVNGGVFVFLCSNLGNGPPGTQACPPPPATLSGSFTAAELVGGAAAQGLAPGELDEAIRAMRAGVTYVNVHSSLFPGGEIRAALEPGVGR